VYEPHNVHGRLVYAVTVKKNGNNRETFTTKVVRSVFVLLVTRGHDILYNDWGEKIRHRSVHRVDSYFRVLCTTAHVLLSYRKLSSF